MVQIAFLDTNVMLDYLESRNTQVRDIIAQLLLFHKKEKMRMATSSFNIAELIDKEFEIQFSGWCLNQKMSFDEIYRKKNNDEFFRSVCIKNKSAIEKRVTDFIFKNDIEILHLKAEEHYQEVLNLIYQYNLGSQDALILATALTNNATYFLSNDSDFAKKISEADLIDTFNLRDEKQREIFNNSVLEAI